MNEADAAILKEEFSAGRRALAHARAAFERAGVVDGEEEVGELEKKLAAAETAAAARAAASRECKEAVAEGEKA
eukprot:2219293-Rhodomonas_salina.1